MIFEQFKQQIPDADPYETLDWIVSLDEVVQRSGKARAQFLLYRLLKRARMLHLGLPPTTQTRYVNTISPEQEPPFPGDEQMERRIRRLIRWNAVAMVIRANAHHSGLGGHLATYASAATLYEVGFNHFFRGKDRGGDGHGAGDHVYFQGHAAPGLYARAFLEGRLTEEHLDNFRREAFGVGISSYPHPRLMPEFWEFPTVSMGLGPLAAIYQARFNRYLHAQGLADTSGSRVWAFLGDGEVDEPESLGALSLAAREGLDNLTFVVNCNLQRLDGPVRGNGKIIQELEAIFRGAGWNVIKVVWGREWDELIANDADGLLIEKMQSTLDGEYQRYQVDDGGHIREQFFGPEEPLRQLVAHLTDEDLKRLRRGGHDARKVYAAYKVATETEGAPTVVLAKTVKGWALGTSAEGRNVAHKVKELGEQELRVFRDRLELPIPDAELAAAPFFHPGERSEEVQYLKERRRALGGFLPKRVVRPVPVPPPKESLYAEFHQGTERQGTGEKGKAATTMVLVRMLRKLMKDEGMGGRIVPVVPDEGRTFGVDPLFKEFGIYNPLGQRYTPVDAEFLISYRESETGRILEEGITEAGSMATCIAAGTSYATHGQPMIPFFLFYSMFGFQRIGDLIWAFADQRGRGFLFGCTAGRTTLAGEGLQHDDGHSIVLASTNPACRVYDPAFAHEVAVVVEDGLRRMLAGEDHFYYVTLYNESYPMPPLPQGDGVRAGILRGLYRYRPAPQVGAAGRAEGADGADGADGPPRAQILGSGTILLEVLRAQELLAQDFGVAADVWSAPSFVELRREALAVDRWNRLHPTEPARRPYLSECLDDTPGPIVAATDWMKAVPDMLAPWLGRRLVALGTDGFGRSDTRPALRRFFEVDAEHIVAATLAALARGGRVAPEQVAAALERYGIDPQRPDPATP
jgi:pyruvate dehydrogenase E1 component